MKKDLLRERIEKEQGKKFLMKMEKRNRWLPLVALGITLLGLLVCVNAIFAPAYAPSVWNWIMSFF